MNGENRTQYAVESVENGERVLRIEREFAHPPAKLWDALIEPSGLEGWFPCRIEGERKLGAPIQFIFDNDNAPPTEGVITEYDPPRVLAYTWANERLRWEVRPTSKGSHLIFTNSIDYIPTDLAAGWHTGLDMLESKLDGKPLPWPVEDRMAALQAEYGKQFA